MVTAPVHGAPVGIAPHTADDWELILNRASSKPPVVHAKPTDADLETFATHALSGGPFVTDDVKRVARAIQRIRLANEHAPLGGRRALIVDGPYHQGKSHSVLIQALTETREVLQQPPPNDANRVIPWIYVELSASGQGRALTASMLEFLGAPVPPRAPMPELVRILRLLAPAIGLRGVIIDDLGSASRDTGAPANPGGMANAIKSLVMQVPATFVLVGTDLANTPLFNITRPIAPAQQVLRRSTWLELQPWPAPTKKVGAWHRLAATLKAHLQLPQAAHFQILNTVGLHALYNLSEGRPGTAIELVQHAAVNAILNRGPLSVATLQQTAAELRGDRP